MGKGFYISKTVGIVGIVLAAGALATITALPVACSQEKSKNNEVKSTDPTMAPSNEPWDQWRLPQTLSPQTYNVTLWPRLQLDTTGLYIFSGLSSVVFRCVEKTNLILIHSNKLNMTKHPTLIGLGSKPAPTIESIVMHTKTQYMAIHLKEELTAGESYELYTEFLGELSDDLGGFYRNEVDITVDDTLVTRTTFAPTEVMSTYLLAFIVSDFVFIEQNIENLQIRIFARQEAINAGQGQYALSVTGPILKFFEKYYNVPYPLPKSEYLGADEAEPDWNIKDLIVLNDVHKVFAIDALASSHPLSSKEEEIQRPEQISEMFDTISYSKGASVLRMLSTFLTEKVFTQGLQTYLDHFKFSNTVYTDLWEHLQKAVDSSGTTLPKTVQEIMDRWILQMGFPVVTINTATGQITQEHFLLDPETKPDRPSEFKFFMAKEGSSDYKKDQVDQMKISGDEWVLANINVTGYYRVNYDNENWRRLLNVLQTSRQSIPVINRAQIIDDAFNLAKAGIIETTLALRTTLFLASETEYMPWESALDNLDYFYLMFDRTEVYGPMQTYVGNQVEVYCSAIAGGGEKEWNFAWEMFEKATVASEKDKRRSAMACASEPWLLNRYLKYTLDSNKIRKQDATSTIISIASNVVGQPLAWDFVRANWEYIFKQYGGGSFSFSNLINGITKRFSTEFELQQASLAIIVELWTVQLLPSTEAPVESWNEYRLPDTLVPDYYNITLWTRLQLNIHGLFVFTGNSSVVFKCLRETSLILIHSNKLNLTSIDGYLAKLSAFGTSMAPSIHKTWMQIQGKLKAGEF
ncbi:hypothetical protein cypCar_00025758 [Cyprinus carpio]|nr:hypothetical protein cypCar_00025758 [Cyprinus carpio]